MTHKECFKCGATKPLSEFYKHPRMKDGHVNKCKDCNKLDVSRNRLANVERYREYDRKRGSRQDKAYRDGHKERYPNKRKAHSVVSNAIRDGKLKRGTECEVCGASGRLEAHHDDYAKPLEVKFLCGVCHKAWHLVHGEGKNG